MTWTEIMQQFTNNIELLRYFARKYWESEVLHKPCWEGLLDKVKVTDILIRDEPERLQLKRDYYEVGQNVERLNFYLDNI